MLPRDFYFPRTSLLGCFTIVLRQMSSLPGVQRKSAQRSLRLPVTVITALCLPDNATMALIAQSEMRMRDAREARVVFTGGLGKYWLLSTAEPPTMSHGDELVAVIDRETENVYLPLESTTLSSYSLFSSASPSLLKVNGVLSE